MVVIKNKRNVRKGQRSEAEQSFKDYAQAKQYRGFRFTPRYCAAAATGIEADILSTTQEEKDSSG